MVLTPVRRSIRKTPQKRSILSNNTPVVVTTPKIISENSPGLRLTPDNGSQSNELAITGASVEINSDTREDDARGMGSPSQVGVVQCELEQEKPAVLNSACKSTKSRSRKSSGKVTFQSPDQERTPECEVFEVAWSSMVTAVLDSEGSIESRAKKSTPQRFSARKCRSRMGTPYYQEGPRRRVSTVDEDVSHGAGSEGRSSSDSDSTDAKAPERCPGPGLRRSARKTPSKYRDSTPLDATSDTPGKVRGSRSRYTSLGNLENIHRELSESNMACTDKRRLSPCKNVTFRPEMFVLQSSFTFLFAVECQLVHQASVVQRVDNAFHRINHYPVDSVTVVYFANTYPLGSDLSGG